MSELSQDFDYIKFHKLPDPKWEENKSTIEDDQCQICLEWIIFDYWVQRDYKRHKGTGLAVCGDCMNA